MRKLRLIFGCVLVVAGVFVVSSSPAPAQRAGDSRAVGELQKISAQQQASCVDGVCVHLVRSVGEYLASSQKETRRFTVLTVDRENSDAASGKDTLFAIVTGDRVSVTPSVSPADFFEIDEVGEVSSGEFCVNYPACNVRVYIYELSMCTCMIVEDRVAHCVCTPAQ